MKVPHDPDDVGGKINGDVLKKGVQEVHSLWCDRVSAGDGVEARYYDQVNETES